MFQKDNKFGKLNKGRKRPDLSIRNRMGMSLETRRKLSESKKGKHFVFRPDNPCPYCKSIHVVSASESWRCFDCKRIWVKTPKGHKSQKVYRYDVQCPKCGSHQIKSQGDRWHCGDCGKEWMKQYKKKEDRVRKFKVSKEIVEDMYWKQNMSQYQIAKKLSVSQSLISLFMKQNNILNRGRIEGLKRRTKESNRKAYKKVSKALKGNTNWRFSHKYPNSEEEKLIRFFDKWNLPFKYVGDGSFKIDGKCPDFINEEKKLIIEFFGELWHKDSDELKRIDFFKQYEWKTLVIWGKELWQAKGKDRNYPKEKQLYDKILKWMVGI